MSQPSNPRAVVVDANILIAICSIEPLTFNTAEQAFTAYASRGYSFFAPNVIIAEVMYIFCQKLQSGILTPITYDEAIENFKDQMKAIAPPPQGETALIKRAKEIQSGYGCSHSADCLYIALAESLGAEFLTFDKGLVNQTAKNAPSVTVNLLPI